MLAKGVQQHTVESRLSPECAQAVYDICATSGLLHDDCSLILDTTENEIKRIIDSKIPTQHREEYCQNSDMVVKTILHSRYVNLYNLLRVRVKI